MKIWIWIIIVVVIAIIMFFVGKSYEANKECECNKKGKEEVKPLPPVGTRGGLSGKETAASAMS